MKTIEATIDIGPKGEVSVQAPLHPELPPGKHVGLLILEEASSVKKKKPLRLGKYNLGFSSPEPALRREEMYGDEGR